MNPAPQPAPDVGAAERVVLFDGVCRLCAGWARFLIRHDRDRVFKLATVQSPEGRAILARHGLPLDVYDTMVLTEGPALFIKSAAFLRVMGGLPFPWPLAGVGWAVPRPLRDWIYDRVAKNRYRLFGRFDACLLPRPDHDARFLGGGTNAAGGDAASG